MRISLFIIITSLLLTACHEPITFGTRKNHWAESKAQQQKIAKSHEDSSEHIAKT